MSSFKLSIIIPTFQSEKTLAHTLASLPKSNAIEVVLIDGGSTDQTLPMIQKFQHPNIRTLSEKDRGIYDAMNKGIQMARGDYIYFLGSDDTWQPESESLLAALTDSNTVYYGSILKIPSQRLYGGYFPRIRMIIQNLPHQGIFYPKAVFKKYSYSLDMKICADHFLNLNCAYDPDFRFKKLLITIAHFSEGGISSNTARDPVFENARRKLVLSRGTLLEKALFTLWTLVRKKNAL